LLEDFEIVGTSLAIALIRRHPLWPSLRENVFAATIASALRLKNLDHVKNKYRRTDIEPQTEEPAEVAAQLYIAAYTAAKHYMRRMIEKLQSDGLPLPINGVFGASVVLERLSCSFFSAHILYRLGHRYEGHAVARLILEQIAWAYVAHTMKQISDIKQIKTTRCVSQLKKDIPVAAKLYGFLSKKTHIDYSAHVEFLRIKEERPAILHTHMNFEEYSHIILELADLFGIVWELSQFEYVADPEAVTRSSNAFSINSARPFLAEKKRLLLEFDKITEDGDDKPR
jgi:hypothetical protein